MKKISFLFLLIAFLIPLLNHHLFSQGYKGQGRMTGTVYDEQGKPLEGVKVKLFSLTAQSGFEVVTDKEGEWKALYIRGGSWDINFEKAGYLPLKLDVQIQEFGKNKSIEARMKKSEGLAVTQELRISLDKGNKLYEEKKFEEAISVYEGIIAANPEATIIYKNIGNSYFELQKYDKAEESYGKVLEKDPDNFEILLLIGNCYANRGQGEKALEYYSKIELEKINDPMVLFNVGSNFYTQSKFEEALKYYQRAIEIQKDFADVIYQLGLTHLALGNYQDAIKAFENYLTYDPDSEKASQVKGFIEFLKKKIGEKIES